MEAAAAVVVGRVVPEGMAQAVGVEGVVVASGKGGELC